MPNLLRGGTSTYVGQEGTQEPTEAGSASGMHEAGLLYRYVDV